MSKVIDGNIYYLTTTPELGNSSAMSRLASCKCSDREGVARDYKKSIEWDLKAIELGNNISMLNISIRYKDLGELKTAREWFEKALAHGDGDAALELARLYIDDEEKEKARYYLNIAVDHDSIIESRREEAKNQLDKLS